MKILFFGDVYGKPGRNALAQVLPKLKKKHQPDFTIANAENLAHGRGPGEKQLAELAALGVDGFTSGNHIFDTAEGVEMLRKTKFPLTRPANYPESVVGNPYIILRKGKQKLLVSNALGRIFMGDPLNSPFAEVDKIIATAKKLKIKHTFIDFHAEATSEKTAFGFYCDGKISAVVGTHTHIQTADERILTRGTAYISDVGFCGSLNSVIGAKRECALTRFLTNLPTKLEVGEEAPFVVSGVIVELKPDGKAKSIERIYEVLS
jgi:metallophosphoesterase (TIGR00282 family)